MNVIERCKPVVFWAAITLQVAIWPAGIWLMATGDYNLNDVGQAMATLILFGAIPMFWAKST
jgi:hypothetical protein